MRPLQQRLYATTFTANEVDIFDLASQHFLPGISVGKSPQGIALRPDGSMLVISNAADGTISIANPDTASVISTISLASQLDPMAGCAPLGIVTTSGNQAVIQISCSSVIEGYLVVLDLTSHAIGCGASSACAAMLPTFSGPTLNLASSGDGSKIFVTEGYFDGALPIGLWNLNDNRFRRTSYR